MLGPSSKYINELVGKKVALWCTGQSGGRDDGVLEGFDGVIVKLRKEKGDSFEIFLFPIYAVRLMKAIEE